MLDDRLPGGTNVSIGAIGQPGPLIQLGSEGRDVGMHPILRGQGGDPWVVVVPDPCYPVDVGSQPLFRGEGLRFCDRGQLEEVADDQDLPAGEAERGKEGWGRGR